MNTTADTPKSALEQFRERKARQMEVTPEDRQKMRKMMQAHADALTRMAEGMEKAAAENRSMAAATLHTADVLIEQAKEFRQNARIARDGAEEL